MMILTAIVGQILAYFEHLSYDPDLCQLELSILAVVIVFLTGERQVVAHKVAVEPSSHFAFFCHETTLQCDNSSADLLENSLVAS
jgi:hypothetical protein